MPLLKSKMRSLVVTLLLASAALGVTGCSTVLIPNTDVEDSTENRRVIQFCEEYRHAMEEKNVGKLLAMVSPMYHSRGVGTHDYVDYDRVKEVLLNDFQRRTTNIRYEIKYQHVQFTETNHILVSYRYSGSYKPTRLDGTVDWKHPVQDNQLDIVPDGSGYKIVAGM